MSCFVLAQTITADTGISIGILLGVLGLIATTLVGVSRLLGRLDDVKDRVQRLEREQYTVPMAVETAFRQAIANPGLKVPDPREPSRFIRVDGVDALTLREACKVG